MTRRLRRLLRRLWPQRLSGQVIVLLLTTLILAQLATVGLLTGERRAAIQAAAREQVVLRTVGLLRLLRDVPPPLQDQVLRATSTANLTYRLDDAPSVARPGRGPVARRTRRVFAEAGVPGVRAAWQGSGPRGRRDDDEHGDDRDDEHDDDRDGEHGDDRDERNDDAHDDDRDERHGRDDDAYDDGDRERYEDENRAWRPPGPPRPALLLAIPFPPERWLNVRIALPPPGARAWPILITLSVIALTASLLAVLLLRRLTGPLQALTQASETLGQGGRVPALPERGPVDVRRLTAAFNAMQARLSRFVADRTRLLAAISHDLRTPITALRLRAELVEDDDTRGKMLATLDDMQRMVEASLAFAREDAALEDRRPVDLAALLQALADDAAEQGAQIGYYGPERAVHPCRPVALKRALGNLLGNARRHATVIELRLQRDADAVRLIVDDDGPGIPAAERERAFQPFVRLDAARASGEGVGLGLSIARDIARAHGGDVTLAEAPLGGLRATLILPRATPARG